MILSIISHCPDPRFHQHDSMAIASMPAICGGHILVTNIFQIFFYKINIFVYFGFCHYLTLISFCGFYNTFLIYKKCQFFFSTILNSVFLNKWQLTICQSITFCGFLLICHSMTCGNWQLECGNPHLCHLVSEIHEIHTL